MLSSPIPVLLLIAPAGNDQAGSLLVSGCNYTAASIIDNPYNHYQKIQDSKVQIDILAMLQFSIAVGVILAVAMWALYFWLKKSGKLKTQEERLNELWDCAARNQGFADFEDFARSHQKDSKTS